MNNKFAKFDLNGQCALITGSAGLLGQQHAAALLECGATVVLTDINEKLLTEAKQILSSDFDSNSILIHVMDVSNPSSIRNVAQELTKNSISVDILVNNAAIDPKVKDGRGVVETSRLENFPIEQWNLQVAVGLTGAFLCSQVFGSTMAVGKGGVILNIASDLSVISPDQRLYRKPGIPENLQPVKPVTYSVIKSGLIGLTKYLATYWTNVRCNALSPGGVYNGQGEDFVMRLSQLIPLSRMAKRDEYRAAVQFLCSDASSYMTGQNIVIDGGRSVW